jgi:dolichol-phosphate mannosyltransferase
MILGIKTRDLTGGFKCFKRSTLQRLKIEELKSNGYSFQIETTYKTLQQGLTVKEIPIIFEDRHVGQSKMSAKIFIEALWMVIKIKLTEIRNRIKHH